MYPKTFIKEFLQGIKAKNPEQINKLKIRLAKKYGLNKIPSNIEILLHHSNYRVIPRELITKPTRALSGVNVVAIMTKPHRCPHGKCITCPGGPKSEFGDVPQSYTGNEPATKRAIRNNYDPFLQVMNRLEQYIVLGHPPQKVELIIMGGTFPALNRTYQEEFVKYAIKALNDFSDRFYTSRGYFKFKEFKEFFMLPGNIEDKQRAKKIMNKLLTLKTKTTLKYEQKRNEKSRVRLVSFVIETRPDYAFLEHGNEMLRLGATKVEIGVQSVYEEALEAINRSHSVMDSIKATQIMKDLGFKINYHMMPGLPGVSKEKDLEGLKELFKNPDFRPDMLKIYPTMVIKGTVLYDWWVKGKYKPLTTREAIELLAVFKSDIPKYVRIMRVQRDIPTFATEAGVDITNLRQKLQEYMVKKGLKCGCIRCNEVGRVKELKGIPKIKVMRYEASAGIEYFISAEYDNAILGFARLRLPYQSLRPEITKNSALLRELHVYGDIIAIGKKGKFQHRGWGKKLLAKAEEIAKKEGKNKIVVISGIGVREYYRKLGYRKQGPYMIKKI